VHNLRILSAAYAHPVRKSWNPLVVLDRGRGHGLLAVEAEHLAVDLLLDDALHLLVEVGELVAPESLRVVLDVQPAVGDGDGADVVAGLERVAHLAHLVGVEAVAGEVDLHLAVARDVRDADLLFRSDVSHGSP